jgi:hypothetical protein
MWKKFDSLCEIMKEVIAYFHVVKSIVSIPTKRLLYSTIFHAIRSTPKQYPPNCVP